MRERIFWSDKRIVRSLELCPHMYWLPAWGRTSPGGVLGAADATLLLAQSDLALLLPSRAGWSMAALPRFIGHQADAGSIKRATIGRDTAPRSSRRLVASDLFGVGGTETCNGIGVGCALGVTKIDPWARLIIEIPTGVSATHQHGGQSCLARASDQGRNIANAEPNAPVISQVGTGIVHQMCVMQRELAGVHRHELGPALIESDRDGLAARQQIVFLIVALGVMELAKLVRARYDLHASGLD